MFPFLLTRTALPLLLAGGLFLLNISFPPHNNIKSNLPSYNDGRILFVESDYKNDLKDIINNQRDIIVSGRWVKEYDEDLWDELENTQTESLIFYEDVGGNVKQDDIDAIKNGDFEVKYSSDGKGWFDIGLKPKNESEFTNEITERKITDYNKNFLIKLFNYRK